MKRLEYLTGSDYTIFYQDKIDCNSNIHEHLFSNFNQSKLETTMKEEKMYSITRGQLKQIHDVACSTWKKKIEEYGKRNPLGDKIEFTQNEINEMFYASDAKQIKVLEGIFEKRVEKKEVKKWEDLESIEGYYITQYAQVYDVTPKDVIDEHKNVFATENQARSALAMAQLGQLMKETNGDWKPNWKDRNLKYVIWYYEGSLSITHIRHNAHFLAFPTKEKRDSFLDLHRELIEEYFLMYQ